MSSRIRSLPVVAVTLALAAGSASAITVTDLGRVLDTSRFGISVNGSSLNVTPTLSGTSYGISVNGSSPLWAGPANLGTVLGALATAANITLMPKDGNLIPIVTLGSDVNIGIWSRTGLTGAGTQLADFSFQAGLTLNPDPAITLPISVLNRSASTQTYSFSFPLVLSPVLTPANSPATLVKSSFTGTLRSDGVGAVSIQPGAGSSIVTTSLLDGASAVSLGVSAGNGQSFAAGSNGDTYTYAAQYNPGAGAGPFSAGPTPSTGFTLMTQSTSFTLSGGDRATMLAYSEISPVPEPEEWALMAAGLVWTLGVVRRQARRGQRRLERRG